MSYNIYHLVDSCKLNSKASKKLNCNNNNNNNNNNNFILKY